MSTPALQQLAQQVIGRNTAYPNAVGEPQARLYFDSAATSLALECVERTAADFLQHQASTHTLAHTGARIASEVFEWAHQRVLSFCRADAQTYACVFIGQGTTDVMNRLAALLAERRPERPQVVCSVMEHHSNDLPHRQHSRDLWHIPLLATERGLGGLDLEALRKHLAQHGDRVNYVAVTAVSNVTGIINPIAEVCRMAQHTGAKVVLDAAQLSAHAPIDLGPGGALHGVDALAFSGHKTYAPGAPGVLVIRRELLQQLPPGAWGGGMVSDVHLGRYELHPDAVERQEAGTPNVLGALRLACALEALEQVGMHTIAAHEQQLLDRLLPALAGLEGIRVYGDTDRLRSPRVGVVSFNIAGLHHGLSARWLSDEHNIAVRNACFCAHPYVRELLTPDMLALMQANPERDPEALNRAADALRGMVRVSFGLHNSEAEIERLISALKALAADPEHAKRLYYQEADGHFARRIKPNQTAPSFDPVARLQQHLQQCPRVDSTDKSPTISP